MESLPEKVNTQSVALAIYNPTPGTKAIDIRRQMLQLPEVAKSLSGVEKYIFAASTKMQIADIDDGTLVAKTGQMFRFIAMDVGYIIPTNSEDWTYICTRLLDILKKYYSQMTLADIKLAFELATTGELDDYLPKDSQGNPDKKHYQQFNADYFAKILNAYRKKQNQVIGKVMESVPEKSNMGMSESEEAYYRNETKRDVYFAFLQYKYTGKMPNLPIVKEIIIYNKLVSLGLADQEIETSEADQKAAMNDLIRRASLGFISKFHVQNVQRIGLEHEDIKANAIPLARKRALREAFERMVKDEIQLVNYLK